MLKLSVRLWLCGGAIAAFCLHAPRAEADVGLSVTSATVTEPGELTRICVLMDDGGNAVAGTQNDLVWDGTCATIEEPAAFSCTANPRHGKQLSAAFPPNTDFTLRAFVLSLNDTDPINETELYCCNVRSELTDPGTSCSINMTRVGASTPDGKALSTRAVGQGRITFAGSGQNRPRPGRVQPSGPVSAVGGNVGGPSQAPANEPATAPGGQEASGVEQPEPVVVPGGGERVEGATVGEAGRVGTAVDVSQTAPEQQDVATPAAAVPAAAAPAAVVPETGAIMPAGEEAAAVAEIPEADETPAAQTTPSTAPAAATPATETTPKAEVTAAATAKADPSAAAATPKAEPSAAAATPKSEPSAAAATPKSEPSAAVATTRATIKPAAPAAQAQAVSDEDDGWGCQVRGGNDSDPATWLLPVLVLLFALRRRCGNESSHHQRRSSH